MEATVSPYPGGSLIHIFSGINRVMMLFSWLFISIQELSQADIVQGLGR